LSSHAPFLSIRRVPSGRKLASINSITKTGSRIKYRKVDASNSDEVDSGDIIKGYEVGKGEYIEIQPEELEAIALESTRTIEIANSYCARKSTSCISTTLITSCLTVKSDSRQLQIAKQSTRRAWSQ
jgi:Ku70/Ku80 beta-barrel domain